MSYPFSSIIILYNPKSTGSSHDNATKLRRQLRDALPASVEVKTRKTQYAGHAEEIAIEYAQKDSKVLIISSSGDGGYHEVVNGVLSHPARLVAVAVLPSGNANDHYHATADKDLLERVLAGKTRQIDVLSVEYSHAAESRQRYAHSYVGIGLTAYIGKRLTAAKLNPVNEKWLVAKYLLRFGHVAVKFKGETTWQRYGNLIVANIDRMSKVIQLSENTEIDDGKFELYTTPRQSVLETLSLLMKGAVLGLKPRKRLRQLEFTLKRSGEMQCDGEVYRLDAGASVRITSERRQLKTLA